MSEHNSDKEINFTIDRELYEELREEPFVIKENYKGQRIHISEDYRSVGPRARGNPDESEIEAWGPVFDTGSEIDNTDTVADMDSKTALLEAATGDILEIRDVITGMRRVPEKLEVVGRTNTYYGPKLKLKAPEDYEGVKHGYMLTCPGPKSHPILWRAVTDPDGFVQSRSKVAKVSVEIFNVSGYDFCEGCGEPIKDPMHRSMAMLGQCQGGFNDSKGGNDDD